MPAPSSRQVVGKAQLPHLFPAPFFIPIFHPDVIPAAALDPLSQGMFLQPAMASAACCGMKWRNNPWSSIAVCWRPVRLGLLITKLCWGILLVTVTIQGLLVVVDEADWLLFSSRGVETP